MTLNTWLMRNKKIAEKMTIENYTVNVTDYIGGAVMGDTGITIEQAMYNYGNCYLTEVEVDDRNHEVYFTVEG